MDDQDLEREANDLLRGAGCDPEYPHLSPRQERRRQRREVPIEWAPRPADLDPEALTVARCATELVQQQVNNLFRRAGINREERAAKLAPLFALTDDETGFLLGVHPRTVRKWREVAEGKLAGLWAPEKQGPN